jgi:hypothetical protein
MFERRRLGGHCLARIVKTDEQLRPASHGPAKLAEARAVTPLGTVWRRALGQLVPVAAATLIWALTIGDTEPRHMTDLGLVSVLPASFFIALGILAVSFVLALRRRETHWLVPALHVVTLIVIIHGTPAVLYESLRYSWAWKHVGVVDYIQRHGSVDPSLFTLQANQNWPGFFALSALVTDAAGLRNALSYAQWAPVFFNALFAGAVLFVCRSLTHDMRLVWLAVWVFCATNWVAQDYFAPQAMSYFLFLVIIGICLRWFRPYKTPSQAEIRRWLRWDRAAALFHRVVSMGTPGPQTSEPGRRRQQAWLVLVVIALFAAVVVSHQLTPFMLLSAVALLVLFQLCATRALPLLMAVLMATWITYMTVGFLEGNLFWVVDSIGKLNVGGSTIANLSHASAEQVFEARVARGLTVLVLLLAVVGLIRRRRTGHFDLPVFLLLLAPVVVVWANAYGGEVLYRVYLFALPFLAFLVAAAVYPDASSEGSRRTPLLAAGLSATLLAAMCIVYYGKDRQYFFTKDEVAASELLHTKAPRGSVFVSGTDSYPKLFRNYERYRYAPIALEPISRRRRVLTQPIAGIRRVAADIGGSDAPVYLIITRSQKAEAKMTGVLFPGSLDRLEHAVLQSGLAHSVYRGPDANVFRLTFTPTVR